MLQAGYCHERGVVEEDMSAGDRDREIQIRECCPGKAEEGERRGELCVYELHLCIEMRHLPVYIP